jgi:uncharacterized coiled-coil protein SlyX
MTRTVRLLPALVVAAILALPAQAADQSQQQVDDLRRRVEEVERQLFQARLAPSMSPQGQAVANFQARLDVLEREIASSARAKTPATDTLAARVEQLEKERAEDAKTIAALTARIAALDKPVKTPKKR